MAAEPAPQSIFQPVELAGRVVRLLPLSREHLPALTAAGADPDIWKWVSVAADTPAGMRAFVEDGVEMQRKGTGVPFTIVEAATGAIVGSTRFANIDAAHRRAEIGWTWLVARCQRTGINTEMKYLMLRHAFEQWGLMRVELKTDELNTKSRSAIKRLGATEEGIFRKHMVAHGGRIRNTVYYSIVDAEWPQVKQRLETMMERTPAGVRAA